jgi:hypothetical protein
VITAPVPEAAQVMTGAARQVSRDGGGVGSSGRRRTAVSGFSSPVRARGRTGASGSTRDRNCQILESSWQRLSCWAAGLQPC